MAFVLAVCGLKGGVGKTTLAALLGCGFHRSGRRTLLVDADAQGTLRTWAGKGSENDIPAVVALDARNLVRDVERIGEPYDVVIVDTPARLGREAKAAMMRADLVLLPTVRGGPGIWTLDETLDLLEEARVTYPALPAYLIYNMADRTSLSEQARAHLEELKLPLVPASLGYRVAIDEAMTTGSDVVAYAPSSEAAREAVALFEAVEKLITSQGASDDKRAKGQTAARRVAKSATSKPADAGQAEHRPGTRIRGRTSGASARGKP